MTSNAPQESDCSTHLASLNCRIFKQFSSLIWQKKSVSRANLAFFASLNICKIILNVCFAHYLQINMCTLAMLTHKLGPSLGFFGLPNFVLLWCFIAGWMPLYLKLLCPIWIVSSEAPLKTEVFIL